MQLILLTFVILCIFLNSLGWVSNMEKKLNPDKPLPDRAMIFSSYSIEQIPMMYPEYLEVALSMAKKVIGFHIEPIASQMRNPPSAGKNVEYNYNQNFVALLHEYQDKGKLNILEENPDWGDVPGGGRDRAGLIIWESVIKL